MKEALEEEVKLSKEGGSKEKTKERQKRKNRNNTLKKGFDGEHQLFCSKNKHRCPSCVKLNKDKTEHADPGAHWKHFHNETYHACPRSVL